MADDDSTGPTTSKTASKSRGIPGWAWAAGIVVALIAAWQVSQGVFVKDITAPGGASVSFYAPPTPKASDGQATPPASTGAAGNSNNQLDQTGEGNQAVINGYGNKAVQHGSGNVSIIGGSDPAAEKAMEQQMNQQLDQNMKAAQQRIAAQRKLLEQQTQTPDGSGSDR